MTKRSIELAALAFALTLAGACKGRTAAWEEKPSKTPEPEQQTKPASDDPFAAGKAAWDARGEGRAKAEEAIAAWEEAMGCSAGATKPVERCAKVPTTAENAETLAMLTRAHYFLADSYMRGDEETYLDYMDRAVWWGERALIAASPEFAEQMRNKAKFHKAITVVGIEALPAMYWYASALGKWARASGFGVLVGQKDNIKATMTRAKELDPNFYHAGPYRYFGAYYAIAPAFAGGDLEKSKESYQKSLELAPYFVGTKILMAENLATKLDDEEMFDRLIQEVLDFDINDAPAEIHPEIAVEKAKAVELKTQKEEDDWF